MSTNKKQEVAIVGNNSISKEEILKNGIEIKINQNDIIDLIVAERIEEIHKKANFLKERAISICKKIQDEYKKELLKSTDFISVFKNKKIKTERTIGPGFRSGYKEQDIINVLSLSYGSTGRGDFMYRIASCGQIESGIENYSASTKKTNIYFEIIFKTTINGVLFKGTKSINIKDFCISEFLIKEIQNHNEEVKEFNKAFNNSYISESSIAKQIKKEFTKCLIQSMDKDFVKKLNDKFKLNV